MRQTGKELSLMNKILINLIVISLIFIVLGLILAAIGYIFGGCQSVQWGADGIRIVGDFDWVTFVLI